MINELKTMNMRALMFGWLGNFVAMIIMYLLLFKAGIGSQFFDGLFLILFVLSLIGFCVFGVFCCIRFTEYKPTTLRALLMSLLIIGYICMGMALKYAVGMNAVHSHGVKIEEMTDVMPGGGAFVEIYDKKGQPIVDSNGKPVKIYITDGHAILDMNGRVVGHNVEDHLIADTVGENGSEER